MTLFLGNRRMLLKEKVGCCKVILGGQGSCELAEGIANGAFS